MKNNFLRVLGIENPDKKSIQDLSIKLDIPVQKLKYYNDYNILPDISELDKIEAKLSVKRYKLMLGMEIYDKELLNILRDNIDQITPILSRPYRKKSIEQKKLPIFQTQYGKLYNQDCIKLMQELESESVDLIFADPPFNLNKFYLSAINDNLSDRDYLEWCEKWIDECIRILKTGGTFYLWNLPKWNSYLADYLNKRLSFKHWIATDIKYTLPIAGRLYPSHYSLLMYTKGIKANTFHPDRMPMEICNNCYKEIKDYGGYKDKMNPKGINLSDVWLDIPPVRHKKYKAREEANELSIKLLDRIIEASSNPGDIVFDPFGGSGTTYAVAEIKERNWIGTELGPVDTIVERFSRLAEERDYLNQLRQAYNNLFTEKVKKERKKRGIWTDDTFTQLNEQGSLFNSDLVKQSR
ncbi:MAG: site-specific DNA-methyltransferase [Chitinophagaceae bacterium]|nr:site-specific DNA-methyltransferase [Chitinophagaceae bacterium]